MCNWAYIYYFRYTELKPCRVGLVVSVSASHTVGREFASRQDHTKDHLKNCTNCLPAGVKKSLVLVPGTSWISGRTSIYFHPMSGGQVKNSMLVYISLTRISYLVTGQVKILMDLPEGQVIFLKIFFTPALHGTQCTRVGVWQCSPTV